MQILRRSRSTAALLALACAFCPIAAAATDDPGAAGTSQLAGRVLGHDAAPLAGATILAYHLSTERLFRSEPTDAKGRFALADLPYGYFDVGVLVADGFYVADVVVNVPPAGKTTVTLSVVPGGAEASLRSFPGTDRQPIGVAAVNRKATAAEFWRGPVGIGIYAGAGAVALITIASDGGGTPSPTVP